MLFRVTLKERSMRFRIAICGLLLVFGIANLASVGFSQEKTAAKNTYASVLDGLLSGTEKTVVAAADAMPDAKYDFAPTQGEFKGVRTFGGEVKHMAVANYALGSGILGEKPPIELSGPNGPENIKSKAEIMKFLNDSFAYAHKAINTINESNTLEPIKGPFGPDMTTRLTLAIRLIGHPYDHYGQMVEYLRMNGIIPPASRK
jgi:DinB superfamily